MEIPKEYRIQNKIWIEPDMFYSEAYQSISRSASTINTLLRCLQKRKWEKVKVGRRKQNIYTNEPFIFPYREAKEVLGIGKTQFWKNIIKLVEVGFIDVEYRGGWYQKHEKEKDYSRYKISERWRKYGTPDFIKIEKEKVLPPRFYIREHMKLVKNETNFTPMNMTCSP